MPQSLETAFKQFTLESQRLEEIFQALNHRFDGLKSEMEDTHTKLYGKIAELDFVTHYLGAILDHISQGIVFIDLNGIVTTYNQAAEKIMGFKSSNVLFRPYTDSFDDRVFGFSVSESLKTKKCPKMSSVSWSQTSQELEIEASFVQSQPTVASSAYQTRPAQSVQGLLILVRNMTEIRCLQEQAGRANRFKELGEMAARLAHEIRNPLGGIRGFASLLQQDLKDRPEERRLAEQIVEGTEGLNRIVANILTFSRALHPHLEPVDLPKLITELIEQVKSDPQYHQRIECQLVFKEPSIIIPMDPSMIKSALLNLIINAFEAMPEGGRLLIEIVSENGETVIKIRDNGVGIAPENVDKLFSPFFTTKDSGNGLGLSEVQKIIQAHGGTISARSALGKGTEFTLRFKYGH